MRKIDVFDDPIKWGFPVDGLNGDKLDWIKNLAEKNDSQKPRTEANRMTNNGFRESKLLKKKK